MVTIIKNQLLKHLSRYTKNLSPEQISLSALRGSGELADLTLDEELLTELLELPAWLKLTSAKCNRATFRIQWTKLKTVPIALNLDEVHIALEVCNEPRPQSSGGNPASIPQLGKYSFVHKVIDGISVAVNSVQIHFSCDAFTSSVQVMRVLVESRTPLWQKGDLTLTRLKCPDTGHLLIFKELEWQSARVEATSKTAADNLPPLRLLVGPSHTRIVLKKRLSDAQVVGCRLVVQAEPLGLALTDGQLRAAAACAAALAPPIQAAAEAARRHAATRKLQQSVAPSEPEVAKVGGGAEREALRRLFNRHDVKETSYHVLALRIDLHLCDDVGLGRSEKPSLANGAALQVSLLKLQADYFPFHLANGDRRHWRGYREAATPHSVWLSQSIHQFRGEILELFDPRHTTHPSNNQANINKEKCEDRKEVLPQNGTKSTRQSETNANNNNEQQNSASSERAKLLHQLSKLMTTCFVLRIDDFTVYKVSTGSRGREPPKPLVSAETTTMPGDAGLLHAEMTFFYYPGEDCFPVPAPKLYAQLSPVRVSVDVDSLVWLGSFFPHVAKALDVLADLQKGTSDGSEKDNPLVDLANLFYVDVKCEAIMPKLVLEAGPEHLSQQRDRPRELHVCMARATLTNVRELDNLDSAGSRSDLAETIAAWHRTAPSLGNFPNYPTEIQERFLDHARGLDDIDRGTTITPELLWRENRSVWNMRAEPLWVETVGTRPNSNRPTPLLDATPASAWVCFDPSFTNIWALARLASLASVQINHYQLLFLLRQLESLSEMAAWLAQDIKRFKGEDDGIISIKAVVPQVEVSVILPTSQNGHTDIQTDAESVRPDTSSLNELKLGNSEVTVAPSQHEASLDSGGFVFPNIEEQTYAPPSPSYSNKFTGFSTMRRGFTSLVSSIDGALSSRDEITSLASSDDDHFVVMGLADETPEEYDQAFRDFESGRAVAVEAVEVAAEVVEEQSSSASVRSVSSSGVRRDLISACTFRLNGVQLSHESHANRTTLSVVSDDLLVSECPSIPWDEFQSKFSMRARGWRDPTLDNDVVRTHPHKLAARLDRTEIAPPACCITKGLCAYEELLEARVRDLSIELRISTALALTDFIQDEVVAQPLPLKVELNDVCVIMTEDRPSRDICTPPEPLKIQLDNLRLSRDDKGILSIIPSQTFNTNQAMQAPSEGDTKTEALETELKLARDDVTRLERENELLRRRLAEHSRQLNDARDETSLLKNVAHAAQRDTEALLSDKHALLDTVRSLQDQLSNKFLGRGGKR